MFTNPQRFRTLATGLVVVTSMTALAACNGYDDANSATTAELPAEPAATVFVTALDTAPGFLAVSLDGDDVRAYYCDGTDATGAATIASYLSGDASSSRISATGELDTASLRAELVGDESISGVLTLADGTTHDFDADLAVGRAGWFSAIASGGDEVGSWIRLDDGSVRGSSIAIDPGTGAPAPSGTLTLGVVPPAAETQRLFDGLRCFLATRRYQRILREEEEENFVAGVTPEAAAANAARIEACHG